MKKLILILPIMLAGCAGFVPPVAVPTVKTAHLGQQVAPLDSSPTNKTPDFIYWAGVETNYSRMLYSSDGTNWTKLPELYFGEPSGTLEVPMNEARGFYRMQKVD